MANIAPGAGPARFCGRWLAKINHRIGADRPHAVPWQVLAPDVSDIDPAICAMASIKESADTRGQFPFIKEIAHKDDFGLGCGAVEEVGVSGIDRYRIERSVEVEGRDGIRVGIAGQNAPRSAQGRRYGDKARAGTQIEDGAARHDPGIGHDVPGQDQPTGPTPCPIGRNAIACQLPDPALRDGKMEPDIGNARHRSNRKIFRNEARGVYLVPLTRPDAA